MAEAGEPFFDRLRELQPEIDIVMLPPAVADEEPVAEIETVETLSAATAHVVRDLLESLQLEAVDSLSRWQRVDAERFAHRTRVRAAFDDATAAGEAVLRLAEVLVGWGWTAHPVEAPAPWVVAEGGRMHVDVAAERADLVLTVTSDAVRWAQAPQ